MQVSGFSQASTPNPALEESRPMDSAQTLSHSEVTPKTSQLFHEAVLQNPPAASEPSSSAVIPTVPGNVQKNMDQARLDLSHFIRENSLHLLPTSVDGFLEELLSTGKGFIFAVKEGCLYILRCESFHEKIASYEIQPCSSNASFAFLENNFFAKIGTQDSFLLDIAVLTDLIQKHSSGLDCTNTLFFAGNQPVFLQGTKKIFSFHLDFYKICYKNPSTSLARTSTDSSLIHFLDHENKEHATEIPLLNLFSAIQSAFQTKFSFLFFTTPLPAASSSSNPPHKKHLLIFEFLPEQNSIAISALSLIDSPHFLIPFHSKIFSEGLRVNLQESFSFSISLEKLFTLLSETFKNTSLNQVAHTAENGVTVFFDKYEKAILLSVLLRKTSFHDSIPAEERPRLLEESEPLLQKTISRAKMFGGSQTLFFSRNNLCTAKAFYKPQIAAVHVDISPASISSLTSPYMPAHTQAYVNAHDVDIVRTLSTLIPSAMRIGSSKTKCQLVLPFEAIIELHKKLDLSVTLSLKHPIAHGTFKRVFQVHKLGKDTKVYAESSPIKPEFIPELQTAFQALQFFRNEHIISARKLIQDSILQYVLESKALSVTQEPRLQTELYQLGSCQLYAKKPPFGPSELYERFSIFVDTVKAVAHIHSVVQTDSVDQTVIRFAHMDVKPANIFRNLENGKIVGKLGDVSIFQIGSKAIISPSYADKEAFFNGKIAHQACDVWALGMTLFNFLYAREKNPFRLPETLSSPEQFDIGVQTLLGSLLQTPFDDIIRECLHPNRDNRPVLSEQFIARLESLKSSLAPEF